MPDIVLGFPFIDIVYNKTIKETATIKNVEMHVKNIVIEVLHHTPGYYCSTFVGLMCLTSE